MLGHRFAIRFGVYALLLIAFPASSQVAAGLDQYNFLGTTSGLTHSANPVGEWSTVGREGLLAKDGEWQWAKRAGGTDGDFGNGVSLDGNENTYITGSFNATADFGSYILTSEGSHDVFVAKLSEPIFTDGFESGNTNAWSASVP